MENNEHNKQCKNPKMEELNLVKYFKVAALKLGKFLVKIGESNLNDEYKNGNLSDTPPFVAPVTSVNNTGIQTVGKESDLDKESDTDECRTGSHSMENISGYKLIHKTIDLINYYDRCAENSGDDIPHAIYNDASNKIIENLILSGCSAINPKENEKYNFIYHTTRPITISSDKIIQRTVRLGVMMDDKVLIKAVVELKEQYNEIL